MPLWRALRVVSGAPRRAQVERARGAVRRPRPRAAADQGPLPRVRRGGTARTSSRSPASPGSASRGSRGSSTSTSTASPQIDVLAPRPLPRLRRRRHLLGARRHGADALPDRRGRGADSALAKLARGARGAHPRRGGAALRRAAARAAARARRAATAPTGRTCSRPGACSSSGWPTSIPTVLAFEDMQWADASLLDFIEYLLEWSRNHPLFVITLARPELLERRPTWGAGAAQLHVALPRAAAGAGDGASCSTASCPGLPAGAARADPRPRRGRAAVRRRDGADAARPGRCSSRKAPVYTPDGEIASLEVPGDAARADRGPPRRPRRAEERRLLQDGAVLGKTFTRAGARRALAGGRGASSSRCSTSLVRKEVLVAPGRPALARARPVRLPPGPRPPRRLRDALEAGSAAARHLAAAAYLDETPRRGRGRRGDRLALRRGLRGGARRRRCAGDPREGARRPRPRGRARSSARGGGRGEALLRAGGRAHGGSGRPGHAARSRRAGSASRQRSNRGAGAARERP